MKILYVGANPQSCAEFQQAAAEINETSDAALQVITSQNFFEALGNLAVHKPDMIISGFRYRGTYQALDGGADLLIVKQRRRQDLPFVFYLDETSGEIPDIVGLKGALQNRKLSIPEACVFIRRGSNMQPISCLRTIVKNYTLYRPALSTASAYEELDIPSPS